MAALAESLRQTVAAQTGEHKTDCRFLFGTNYSNNFNKPPVEAYTTWHPLPLSSAQQETHALATHLISRSSIFPRLQSGPEHVKSKVVPHLNALADACKAHDPSSSGVISEAQLLECLQAAVFLTRAEMEQLLTMAPYVPDHKYSYTGLIDVLLGKSTSTLSANGVTLGRPPLPHSVEWPADQGFQVTLRLRPSTQPFTIPAERMVETARHATKLCRAEVDCEKVHALLRTHLLDTLLIEPGRPDHPDLAFRQWLAGNSVMSLTLRQKPGPIPPEVYDVLDQVIYEGLGLPRAMSPTQTLTSLGVSLRRNLD